MTDQRPRVMVQFAEGKAGQLAFGRLCVGDSLSGDPSEIKRVEMDTGTICYVLSRAIWDVSSIEERPAYSLQFEIGRA